MSNNEYNRNILQEIRMCIDILDVPRLWGLALSDPPGVLNKMSIRQLGRKRIEKLNAYLRALDSKKLNENHGYELLLLSCIERELGAGMFVR